MLLLDHVQVSIQDTDPNNSEKIAGFKGHQKKIETCGLIRQVGLPLTVNAVMHRQNLHNLKNMIELAVELDAERLEVAQVQYYGWALKNQTAFLPTREQLDKATIIVEDARIKYKGILAIDYVVPDYYAKKPKSCMGGWGRQFLNITPAGKLAYQSLDMAIMKALWEVNPNLAKKMQKNKMVTKKSWWKFW